MKSGQTPLHKVQGMGAAHTGTGHFWRERVTALALAPLSLWFLYVMLGMVGASVVTPAQFFQHPWNGALMAAFISFSLYHASLGLQVVIEDYVHGHAAKLTLIILIQFAAFAFATAAIIALLVAAFAG